MRRSPSLVTALESAVGTCLRVTATFACVSLCWVLFQPDIGLLSTCTAGSSSSRAAAQCPSATTACGTRWCSCSAATSWYARGRGTNRPAEAGSGRRRRLRPGPLYRHAPRTGHQPGIHLFPVLMGHAIPTGSLAKTIQAATPGQPIPPARSHPPGRDSVRRGRGCDGDEPTANGRAHGHPGHCDRQPGRMPDVYQRDDAA